MGEELRLEDNEDREPEVAAVMKHVMENRFVKNVLFVKMMMKNQVFQNKVLEHPYKVLSKRFLIFFDDVIMTYL